jgi:hypothetical protein
LKIDMGKLTRWIAIISSLCIAWAVQAATTKKQSHTAHSRNTHASYRTARYARQTTSQKSHAKSRRRSRRRRYYRHRVRLPKAPSRERITQIQTALARGGYYKGDPTGKWDRDTIAAVQKFQSANNMGATGKLDTPTLQKLGLGSDIAGVAAPKPLVPKNCCSTGPPASKPAAPTNSPKTAPGTQPQPASAASGNSQSLGGATGASTAAAIAPAATSGDGGTSNSASASKQNSAQR